MVNRTKKIINLRFLEKKKIYIRFPGFLISKTKDSPYTGRITRSMNGASPTDAWNRSRPSVGSGNGGRMLRSQVPKEGRERKGIT